MMWLTKLSLLALTVWFGNAKWSESASTDKCSLPFDMGPCRGNHVRWFYFASSKKCDIFTYGGCKGNANNFRTYDECQKSCIETEKPQFCSLAPLRGSCRGRYKRWYYHGKAKRCFRFTYGGCHGNKNNFMTQQKCQATCGKPKSFKHPSKVDICHLPHAKGSCRGHYTRWYYDRRTHTCKSFIYTGCNGNQNNFYTRGLCQNMCRASRELATTNKCLLPPEKGPCLGNLVRWFYMSRIKLCLPFVYGGCHGNGNKFLSHAKCMASCK